MKKNFVLLTLLLVAVVMTSACSSTAVTPEQPAAQAPATEAPQAEEPVAEATKAEEPAAEAVEAKEEQTGDKVELTFSVWGDPEELAILQEIADDFVAQNPNVNITVNVSDWDTYWDKLQTTLAAGAPPDVFAVDAPLYPDYQSRGVLLNSPYSPGNSPIRIIRCSFCSNTGWLLSVPRAVHPV